MFKPQEPKAAPKEQAPADKYIPKFNKQVGDLPSHGLPYPPGMEVSYRPYSFGEVKTISGSHLSKREHIEHGLSGIQCSHGFDPLELTFSDFLFVAFLRKRATFVREDKVVFDHYCRKCQKRVELILEESKSLEFRDIEAPALPVSFQMHGENFSFSPLTVKKSLEFIDILSRSIESDEDLDESIAVLALQCTSHPYEQAYEAIYNASPEEAELLGRMQEALAHELKPVSLKCQCGADALLALDEVDRLVMPFRSGQGEPGAAGLRFGPGPGDNVRGRVRPGLPGGQKVR